ncbi:MAG: protein-disulfide reductase DsbD [Candidatus Kaistia colombiensis]|nr:MAG: protein-disulfide reductase DsbD [Kaistia sp.]
MPEKLIHRTILAIVCLVALLGGAALAQAPLPVDDAFRLLVRRDADAGLRLEWQIASGHYLYRDKILVAGDKAPAVATPPGETKDDPNFGPTEIYHDHLTARLGEAPPSGSLRITYQGCAEDGICYPPVTKALDLATLELSEVETGFGFGATREVATVTPASLAATGEPALATAAPAAPDPTSLMTGNLAWTLAAFLGFGLLLSLTPCVFPMIPILSGMLARSGESLSARRGFGLSSVYVVAMALAYAALGLVAAWSGQNLQVVLQAPWALGLMAAVFTLLALSMFGLFELQVPARWTGWIAGRTQGRAGSIAGAAALGFGSALIVGPCVTPPLAAALLYVAQTGDGARGAAALFALGLGMGLPLIVFGTFGGRFLPRSGLWLVRVKQAFGLVFLGLAAAMLLRALPEDYALPVWGVGALGVAAFLGAFDALDAATGWGRRLQKSAGLALAIYGATLIVGFAGGATDPLRPLAFLAGGRRRPGVRVAGAGGSVGSRLRPGPVHGECRRTPHSCLLYR